MRKVILILAVAVIGLTVWSCGKEKEPAAGSVYGMITDAETNEPVPGAQVMLSPGNVTTVTGGELRTAESFGRAIQTTGVSGRLCYELQAVDCA